VAQFWTTIAIPAWMGATSIAIAKA